MGIGTKELRRRLSERGAAAAAKATLHITGARRVGRIVTFEVKDALAFNTLTNESAKVEKALSEMLGGRSKLVLVRSFDDRKAFSDEMLQLQRFFGGTLIHTDGSR